jgi:hypothetical protein
MTQRINWAARPKTITEEKERRAREEATYVVKVVYDMLADDAVVYREGRMGLKHQDLTDAEKALLDDEGKGYFYARWSNSEVRWVLSKQAPAKAW